MEPVHNRYHSLSLCPSLHQVYVPDLSVRGIIEVILTILLPPQVLVNTQIIIVVHPQMIKG